MGKIATASGGGSRFVRQPRQLACAMIWSAAAHTTLLVLMGSLLVPLIRPADPPRLEATTLSLPVVDARPITAKTPAPTLSLRRSVSNTVADDSTAPAPVRISTPLTAAPYASGPGGAFAGAQEKMGGSGSLLTEVPAADSGAEFFGVRATGSRFVFVVDSSGSMMIGNRWQMACQELLNSISQLGEQRTFFVVFFDGEAHPMFSPGEPTTVMVPASEANITRLTQWMNQIQLGMATKPLGAVRQALALRPDAIFLLSDGEFQDATAMYLRRENQKNRKRRDQRVKTVIHTIGLDSVKSRKVLERIARENGGTYQLVPGRLVAEKKR